MLPKDMGLQHLNKNILVKQHKLIVNSQKVTENPKLESLYSERTFFTVDKRDQILDVFFDITESEKGEPFTENYSQEFGLFEIFQTLGGVQKLIEVLLKSLT